MTGDTCHNVRRWLRYHAPVLSLTYETMIANDRLTEPTRRALSQFLGARVVDDRNRMPRKLAPPLDRLVINLAEIRGRLADEGLEWTCDLESPRYRNESMANATVPPAAL